MKRSYHTDILIQYKLGILPKEIERRIPTSTLHNWKMKDVNTLFGIESVRDYEENMELVKEFLSQKAAFGCCKSIVFHLSYLPGII